MFTTQDKAISKVSDSISAFCSS